MTNSYLIIFTTWNETHDKTLGVFSVLLDQFIKKMLWTESWTYWEWYFINPVHNLCLQRCSKCFIFHSIWKNCSNRSLWLVQFSFFSHQLLTTCVMCVRVLPSLPLDFTSRLVSFTHHHISHPSSTHRTQLPLPHPPRFGLQSTQQKPTAALQLLKYRFYGLWDAACYSLRFKCKNTHTVMELYVLLCSRVYEHSNLA